MEQTAIAREFRFGSLLRFALPTIVMMVFMSLYTIVDGIFISQFIGTDALSAVNLVYPAINLILALAIMLGTGGSAVVARKMGEGDVEGARKSFTFLVVTGVLSAVVLAVLGLVFLEPLCYLLGANDALLGYCKDYLSILLLFAPASVLQLLFQSFFVTAGKPIFGMVLTIVAGVVNAVLDYVFIVPVGMGIAGAALATAIGYMIPAVAGLIFFAGKKHHLRFSRFTLNWRMLGQSCFNGSSEMVTNISGGIITFLYNLMMMRFLGSDGVAAITIVLYAQFLLTALYMGFSMGVAPVISYNYGSGNSTQLKRLVRICLVFTAVSSLAIFVCSMLLSGKMVEVFTPVHSAVYGIAHNGFLLFSLSFFFAGINIFASAFFTALSNGRVSAIISFLRTLVFILLGLLFLPALFEVNGLWLAVPFAELLTLCLSVYFLRKHGKTYHYR